MINKNISDLINYNDVIFDDMDRFVQMVGKAGTEPPAFLFGKIL